MVNPVPGYSVTTAYRKTSTGSWETCGWHTGQDYAAPSGADVVAARGGTVAHVDYGDFLGEHQFVIRPGDGTEDLYCHTKTRPANGAKVSTGQYVAEVGREGNATGDHLHFERHKWYGWDCELMDDPMKSHNYNDSPGKPVAVGELQEVEAMLLQRKSDKAGVLIAGGKAIWVSSGADYSALDTGGLPAAVVSDDLFGDVVSALGGGHGG